MYSRGSVGFHVDNQQKKLFQFLSFASRKAELLHIDLEIIMNSLTNNFAFYIMQIVCSEGILLGGSNVLDKAQIEKSVLYPAFLFLRATSQAGMLACTFGDCRKGQIPRCSAALQI